MKAHVEHRWPSDTVAIWFYRRAGLGDVEVLVLPAPAAEAGVFSAAPTWRPHEPGSDYGPPTLELPTIALEVLAEAASDLRPPSTEQAAALADTRATRDRLLGLVEGLVLPPTGAGPPTTIRPA